MHTVPNSEVKILNILKFMWDAQGNGQFATDKVCKRTSGRDPRSGMFHHMWPRIPSVV